MYIRICCTKLRKKFVNQFYHDRFCIEIEICVLSYNKNEVLTVS